MTLAEVCFEIHPQTGDWVPVARATAKAPYVTFERRPTALGETYRVRHSGGHLTDDRGTFVPGSMKLVQILHHVDGSTEATLYYAGPGGEPVDHLPGISNA